MITCRKVSSVTNFYPNWLVEVSTRNVAAFLTSDDCKTYLRALSDWDFGDATVWRLDHHRNLYENPQSAISFLNGDSI